jgi:type I restriction enzyme S subunit
MSARRYPAYKPSGVEWLGEVPTHWEVLPLKRVTTIVGGATPKSEVTEFWDGGIAWVTPADLGALSSFEFEGTSRTLSASGLAACSASLVPPGSLVVSVRAPIGSLGINAMATATNQGCKSLVPGARARTRFLAYQLRAGSTELNAAGKGTTFVELSGDALGAFRVVVPPLAEQEAIAAFLDAETAKIDALVAEQDRLVGLLREKRQAVISHAVTRGLDPAAPMKPSGVEWLGEVPAHWEVVPLKRWLLRNDGGVWGNDPHRNR